MPVEHLIAYSVSIIIVLLIVGIAARVIGKGEKEKAGKPDRFRHIIWDRFGYPSLSLFQFFLWTGVISFGFLSIYLIRIFEGVFESPVVGELPVSILVLMGISTAVPVARSRMLVKQPNGKQQPSTRGKAKNVKFKNFSWLLQDKSGKPTLPKFQMFTWTWIAIIIYLAILFSSVSNLANTPMNELDDGCKENRYECLRFPDIDPSLTVLMGLSQGAYLGAEFFTIKRKDPIAIAEKMKNEGDMSEGQFKKFKKDLEEN